MLQRNALPRIIARRLASRESRVSWSRPVVQIATVGVAIGMALIVLASSIVHGFQEEVKELVVGFGSDVQVLNADYDDSKIIRQPAVEEELRGIEGVAAVHPFYTMPGILESKNGVKGVLAKGVDASTSDGLLGWFLREGSAEVGAEFAVLSREQAQRLEVGIGDALTLYLVGGPSGVRARTLRVGGIYRTGLLEYDQEFVFVPAGVIQQSAGWGMDLQLLLDSAGVEARAFGSRTAARVTWYAIDEEANWRQKSWDRQVPWTQLTESQYGIVAASRDESERLIPDSVRLSRNGANQWKWERIGGGWPAAASGLEVFAAPDGALWEIEHEVYQRLPIGWRTETVTQQAPEMFTWLGMLDLNVEIIIGLMVLISIINMTSALLILILERRPMVGMLKALGMSNGQVMQVFFWQAVRILGRGFVWGNAVGFLLIGIQYWTGWASLNPEAYYLDVVPVRVDPLALGFIEGVAFASCVVMMWLPSLASMRIHPAEALRMHR